MIFGLPAVAYLQTLGVLVGIFAAWAWMQSATLSLWPNRKSFLDRISTDPVAWNAIAAFLSAGVAVIQALVFLTTLPA